MRIYNFDLLREISYDVDDQSFLLEKLLFVDTRKKHKLYVIIVNSIYIFQFFHSIQNYKTNIN